MTQYITIKQASMILGVSALTLRNWDRNGKFPARRHPMNNYRVYKLDDLEKIVEDIELGGAIGTNAKKKIRQLIVRSEE
jgi:DNA-binding transcriptional MerR regulator